MDSARPPKSSNVPGQHLGYSLQVTECVRRLLIAEQGCIISVEAFDDVGIARDEGLTAVQTKSGLVSNPIADHSLQLWKTFSNWINALKSGEMPLNTSSFEIHVFSPKSGEIAKLFSAAKTSLDAKAALEKARTMLWGKAPHYPNKSKVSATIEPYVSNFLGIDEKLAVSVIQRFDLTFGSGSSRADLEAALKSKWAPEHAIGEILDKALGWVKTKVDAAHELEKTAAISVDEFNKEITSFISKLRFSALLYDFAKEFTPATSQIVAEKLRMYVAQLQLIEEEEEEILHAINSVLRASSNRTIWGKRGLVQKDSFDELEESLKKFWKNTKKLQDLDHQNDQPIIRGQRLYLECLRYRTNLEGKIVPDDFAPASFHELADILAVGWHPEFAKVLKKK